MDKQKNKKKSEVALREEEILQFWKDNDIFNKTIETPAGKKPEGDFVFYDGPPFATGTPHYGHILPGTTKDAVPKFQTMNGKRVIRKWGWDCHGLPLENLIEKRLGLATKRDIEEFGIKEFNDVARNAVMEYADDWRRFVPRMGRFVDMENDYRTMDSSYTESVWWVFSELNRKGFVYEGFKSMHLCPRCGTTLSNFEVNQGYKDIKDIAVTVKLPLLDDSSEKTNTSLLVWTTTPWTLPGNMAAAVHKDIEYKKIKLLEGDHAGETIIIAKGRVADTLINSGYIPLGKDLESEDVGPWADVSTIKGSELVGKSYIPPFDYWQKKDFENKENAWKIYHADYVEIGEDGTGAVHLAPAYGEEDMILAKEQNIPIMHHVGKDGRFMDFITDFGGQLVKPKDDDNVEVTHLDADIEVLKKLKERDVLFKKEKIAHSYPHCWRCHTPLLNYGTTSWFVRVTDMKDKLIKENNKIKWVPEHIGKNRFGKWLEGARDWAISRQRYWGAPLPIWRNPKTKEVKILGSLSELQEYLPKSKNKYFTMRHGESESNAKNIISTDIEEPNPLTEKGKNQIDSVISDLKTKGITRIIYSPFERTTVTTELVVEGLGLPDNVITIDKRIGEIQLGEFNGQDNSVYRDFLNSGENWHDCSPVKGESWIEVKRRVGEFLYEIDEKYKNETILIISHNSPLRLLGTIHDGRPLGEADYDHDSEGRRYDNAEVRELPFIRMPHNDDYALDYHRPYIDEIELFDKDGTKMKRVPDVFDCWFESGSMPYGQHHYPFENKKDFEKNHYPAQFIAEGLDQTRGWFYSLLVLGTALFGKSPFENVIVNGTILAEDGQKMSKSLQNYPDPMHIINEYGADTMRYYLLSSSAMRAEDLSFSEKEISEIQRKNIGRLHNVLIMYEMFTNESVETDNSSKHVLDKWIISRLNETITKITEGYTKYELDKATRPLTDLIDDISVWYLRRSRGRLKGKDAKDKQASLETLKYILKTLSLLMAPVMPFYAEYLFQRVKDSEDAESVHLMRWPKESKVDTEILEGMKEVRRIVSEALELRSKKGLKVRQPLQKLSFDSDVPSMNDELFFLIKEEINVKEIKFTESTGGAIELDTNITPELQKEGNIRELIRAIQDARKEKGLKPQDRIQLLVDDDTVELILGFEEMIKEVVGASEIFEAKDTEKIINIDKKKFSFTIQS